MNYEKKSYTDFFIENNTKPKKRERYFLQEQEDAIVRYNDPESTQRERDKLFENTINVCFKKTIAGVLEMPMFHNLKKINREELIEATFIRLLEKIHKFTPGKVSPKTGLPVKAFSYFSTIAKHFILEQIGKNEKILRNKADVEQSIDLSILSEDNLQQISSESATGEYYVDDYIKNFELSKKIVVSIVENIIQYHETIDSDKDLIKLAYCLRYILNHWEKVEFHKKNEFMRILTLYSGFTQQKVSMLFKKIKDDVVKKISLNGKNFDRFKDDIELEIDEVEEEEIIERKYQVNSLEEYELYEQKYG